ncbi:MAG: MFS transporter [Methylobacterium mesophilicum]|nr:MFS transporter [Methylobacterium mesophilicum]
MKQGPARRIYATLPPPPPYTPRHPAHAGLYILASVLLAVTQGFGLNMVTANLPQIQGSLGATTNEATWLVAAYMAPNVSLGLLLVKVRAQFGLRNFAEVSIVLFALAALLNFQVSDFASALLVRFVSGVAAAPLSTLGFLYMLEAFPPERKLTVGMSLALTNTALGAPLTRLISPALLDIGGWHGLTVFELSLALAAFCAVYLLPLTSAQRVKVLEPMDFVSYFFLATGLGSFAVVLALGRLYWWFEAPWLGLLLALGVFGVTVSVVIELNRANPLLDIRWLVSPAVLHFAGVLLLFRVVLTEQTTGAPGFFQVMNLSNDQMRLLYGVILASTIAGGFACASVLKPGREPQIHAVALGLLALGAYLDAHATNLTRPAQMLASQAMIAFAGALFLPPAMAAGFVSALKKGPNYILSFIIVFLTTQSLGSLLGSALLGTFITVREKFHSNVLVEHLTLADPFVAQRVAQLGGTYGRTLTDRSLLNAEGVALLGQQATREANVLAYNDLFLLVSALAASALVLLLLHMAFNALRSRLSQPVSDQPA